MSIAATEGSGSMSVQYLWNKNLSLSPVEKQILNMEKEGKTVKEIAFEMHRSSREIQRTILSIKSKLKGKISAE